MRPLGWCISTPSQVTSPPISIVLCFDDRSRYHALGASSRMRNTSVISDHSDGCLAVRSKEGHRYVYHHHFTRIV